MSLERVTLAAAGDIAAHALLWRRRVSIYVSIIVKWRVKLVHEDRAVFAGAAPFVTEEEHLRGDPRAVLERATDLVPTRPRCDVTVVRAQSTSPSMRLTVRRGATTLLDKTADATTAFAPIPSSWPARRIFTRSADPRQGPDGIVEVPADLVDDYFQAAPEDQQVGGARGDEWITLEGFHASTPRLVSRLDGARAVVRMKERSIGDLAPWQTLDAQLDTIAIDATDRTATLTWRATRLLPAGLRSLAKTSFEAVLSAAEPDAPSGVIATAPLDPALLARDVAPFALAKARKVPSLAEPIPGAPWTVDEQPPPERRLAKSLDLSTANENEESLGAAFLETAKPKKDR